MNIEEKKVEKKTVEKKTVEKKIVVPSQIINYKYEETKKQIDK